MAKKIGNREVLSADEIRVRAYKRAKSLKAAIARLNDDLEILRVAGVSDEGVSGALRDLKKQLLAA